MSGLTLISHTRHGLRRVRAAGQHRAGRGGYEKSGLSAERQDLPGNPFRSLSGTAGRPTGRYGKPLFSRTVRLGTENACILR